MTDAKQEEIDWIRINKIYDASGNDDEYNSLTWGSRDDIQYLCDCLYKIKEAKTPTTVFTLLKDVATIKEAFIIDELKSYMDFTNPSKPVWTKEVRLRLQEKKDWEFNLKQSIKELREKNPYKDFEGRYRIVWVECIEELEKLLKGIK